VFNVGASLVYAIPKRLEQDFYTLGQIKNSQAALTFHATNSENYSSNQQR